jgi:hypothetical protein
MIRASAMLGFSFLLASSAAFSADDKMTTTITRSQNGTSVITQSGDPSRATTKVERKGGSTTITRKSGGNTSTVIQGQGGDIDDLPPEMMTPELRRLLDMMRK